MNKCPQFYGFQSLAPFCTWIQFNQMLTDFVKGCKTASKNSPKMAKLDNKKPLSTQAVIAIRSSILTVVNVFVRMAH